MNLDQVVLSSTNTHPVLAWIIGVVTLIEKDAAGKDLKTCTVAVGPNDNNVFVRGAGIVGVPRLDQYTPTEGDVVHMLSQEANGMLILGSVGRVALNVPLPPGSGGTEPSPTVLTAVGESASGNVLVQGSQVGDPVFWNFPTLHDVINQARALGTVVGFQIIVTLLEDGPVGAFVLVDTQVGAIVPGYEEPHLSVALPYNVPTAVDLPIGWSYQIGDNAGSVYTIGLQSIGRAQLATFDISATAQVLIQTG